jgi:hypothetical protein
MRPRNPCRSSPEDQAELRHWWRRVITAFFIVVFALLAAELAHRYVARDTPTTVLQTAK